MAALDAAEAEGGICAAASRRRLMVVARGRPAAQPGTTVDLRVEDHAEPLTELAGCGASGAPTRTSTRGPARGRGRHRGALPEYAAAHRAQPDNAEFAFWHGAALAAERPRGRGPAPAEQAFAAHGGWRELLTRLPAAGLFPDDAALIARLVEDTRAERCREVRSVFHDRAKI